MSFLDLQAVRYL